MHKIHPHSGLPLFYYTPLARSIISVVSLMLSWLFIYFMFLNNHWQCFKICIRDLHIGPRPKESSDSVTVINGK